jgi:hypothetical protein
MFYTKFWGFVSDYMHGQKGHFLKTNFLSKIKNLKNLKNLKFIMQSGPCESKLLMVKKIFIIVISEFI